WVAPSALIAKQEKAQPFGSTFWLELAGRAVGAPDPVDAVEHSEENTNSHDEAVSKVNKTVLYIEDNPANLSLMEMIISRTDGIDLISAFNAEIGIDMARAQKPDLILLDINLPGMNGFEALKVLKEMEESAETPVIAVSAAAAKKDIDAAIKAGFNAYLTKPINVQNLLDTLKSNLGMA
ncbi:MAG: response regulator, partial [Proteobacteria bacterium]|nr:response regulator [Pseudomonadota bacterium]